MTDYKETFPIVRTMHYIGRIRKVTIMRQICIWRMSEMSRMSSMSSMLIIKVIALTRYGKREILIL